MAGERAFAAEAFACSQLIRMVTLGRDQVREVTSPLPTGAILAKLNTKFARLSHSVAKSRGYAGSARAAASYGSFVATTGDQAC